jgi:hypothetical protein
MAATLWMMVTIGFCRGEARAGTTRFYRCATAYLMLHDVRLTLAIVFVKPKMDKLTVLKRLFSALQAAQIRIKCLYADKGFCCIPVLRYLSRRRIRAIMAMPIRGKQASSRALCRGPKSYWTSYTLQSAEEGKLTSTCGSRAHLSASSVGPAPIALVAVRGSGSGEPLLHVRRRYRRRFGIETGYRLIEQVRARTTSPNPALRFVLMGVALLIVNMWIRLHWLYLRLPGRGPRRVARWRFRFDRMRGFLTRAIERFYGVSSAVDPAPI